MKLFCSKFRGIGIVGIMLFHTLIGITMLQTPESEIVIYIVSFFGVLFMFKFFEIMNVYVFNANVSDLNKVGMSIESGLKVILTKEPLFVRLNKSIFRLNEADYKKKKYDFLKINYNYMFKFYYALSMMGFILVDGIIAYGILYGFFTGFAFIVTVYVIFKIVDSFKILR